MRFSFVLFVAVMVAATFAGAMASDQGLDGVTVLSITPQSNAFLTQPFVIAATQSVYTPGSVVSATFGSDVPYNTRMVVFRIQNTAGTILYSKDVTDLFSPATTSYVKFTFTAPSTAGSYGLYLDFKDAYGNIIYTDSSVITVSSGATTCPTGYCTSWSNTQRVQNGWMQAKSCYTIAQDAACTQTSYQYSRTTCDSGYVLQNNQCVVPSTPSTCGDGKVESGEQCDNGAQNGVCPATCNSFCQTATCTDIPGFQTPAGQGLGSLSGTPGIQNASSSTPPPGSQNTGDHSSLIIAGVLLLAGGYFLFTRKKR